MKKYFIFAAIAAAGLLTSCSSSDDAISEGPGNPDVNADLVQIKIGVAQPVASITRGTGTVGGVVNNTGVAANDAYVLPNSWAGQTVNVYMFNHGTLNVAQFTNLASANPVAVDIYNNAVLTTPSTGNTGIANYLTDGPWGDPAVPERYVKYYPMTGNFDFWGYRIDDATAADPAVDGDVLKTVISVDGTQDVLSGVANIPATYADLTAGKLKDAVDAYKTANSISTDEDAYTQYKASRLFSASAARADVQPELKFGHMMTRLTFNAYAGSDDAKAYTELGGTAAVFDPGTDSYEGVYVAGINVRAISSIDETDPANPVITYVDPTKGTFKIAGTASDFKPSLTWANATATPAAFELQKRGDKVNKTTGDVITLAAYNALSGSDQANYRDATANDKLISIIDATVLNTNNKPDYDKNGAILLWNTATDGSTKNSIGESIIAPSAAAYEIDIILCQRVVTVETINGVPVTYEDVKWNTIKRRFRAGYDANDATTNFQPGTSYNFSIKVYGLERIAITTTLTPWEFGENLDIDTDN